MGEDIHQPILKKVGDALKLGTTIAAICGATLGLANEGYLNSRKHTSNDLDYMNMVCPNYKGETFYEKGLQYLMKIWLLHQELLLWNLR